MVHPQCRKAGNAAPAVTCAALVCLRKCVPDCMCACVREREWERERERIEEERHAIRGEVSMATLSDGGQSFFRK